jgi:DNA modification methylase
MHYFQTAAFIRLVNSLSLIHIDNPFGVETNQPTRLARGSGKVRSIDTGLSHIKDHDRFLPAECRSRAAAYYRGLNATGTLLLRVSDWQIPYWREALEACGFTIAHRTLIILKDPKRQRFSVQYTQPFSTTFSYLVAYKGTNHYWEPVRPDGPFVDLHGNNPRGQVLSGALPPLKGFKLKDSETGVPFRAGEIGLAESCEMTLRYTPPGGTILECMSGTCPFGLAALRTGRTCICVDIDVVCLTRAEIRCRCCFPY